VGVDEQVQCWVVAFSIAGSAYGFYMSHTVQLMNNGRFTCCLLDLTMLNKTPHASRAVSPFDGDSSMNSCGLLAGFCLVELTFGICVCMHSIFEITLQTISAACQPLVA
jgi:hypothetical protein